MKNLLNEINRIREIMGVSLLVESKLPHLEISELTRFFKDTSNLSLLKDNNVWVESALKKFFDSADFDSIKPDFLKGLTYGEAQNKLLKGSNDNSGYKTLESFFAGLEKAANRGAITDSELLKATYRFFQDVDDESIIKMISNNISNSTDVIFMYKVNQTKENLAKILEIDVNSELLIQTAKKLDDKVVYVTRSVKDGKKITEIKNGIVRDTILDRLGRSSKELFQAFYRTKYGKQITIALGSLTALGFLRGVVLTFFGGTKLRFKTSVTAFYTSELFESSSPALKQTKRNFFTNEKLDELFTQINSIMKGKDYEKTVVDSNGNSKKETVEYRSMYKEYAYRDWVKENFQTLMQGSQFSAYYTDETRTDYYSDLKDSFTGVVSRSVGSIVKSLGGKGDITVTVADAVINGLPICFVDVTEIKEWNKINESISVTWPNYPQYLLDDEGTPFYPNATGKILNLELKLLDKKFRSESSEFDFPGWLSTLTKEEYNTIVSSVVSNGRYIFSTKQTNLEEFPINYDDIQEKIKNIGDIKITPKFLEYFQGFQD